MNLWGITVEPAWAKDLPKHTSGSQPGSGFGLIVVGVTVLTDLTHRHGNWLLIRQTCSLGRIGCWLTVMSTPFSWWCHQRVTEPSSTMKKTRMKNWIKRLIEDDGSSTEAADQMFSDQSQTRVNTRGRQNTETRAEHNAKRRNTRLVFLMSFPVFLPEISGIVAITALHHWSCDLLGSLYALHPPRRSQRL